MEDSELEDTAYLHKNSHGTWTETYNNANFRSIAISLKRIADLIDHPGAGPTYFLEAMLDEMEKIASALHPEERK